MVELTYRSKDNSDYGHVDMGRLAKKVENVFKEHYKLDTKRLLKVEQVHLHSDSSEFKRRMKNTKFKIKTTLFSRESEVKDLSKTAVHGFKIVIEGSTLAYNKETKTTHKFNADLLLIEFVQEREGTWQPPRIAHITPLHPEHAKAVQRPTFKSENRLFRIAYDILSPHTKALDKEEAAGIRRNIIRDLERHKLIPHALNDYDYVGGQKVDHVLTFEVYASKASRDAA